MVPFHAAQPKPTAQQRSNSTSSSNPKVNHHPLLLPTHKHNTTTTAAQPIPTTQQQFHSNHNKTTKQPTTQPNTIHTNTKKDPTNSLIHSSSPNKDPTPNTQTHKHQQHKEKYFPQNIRVPTQNHPILLVTLMIKISSWVGTNFGVDQDEILIINVIKRIGWFWGGRAKRVHPKITNSFDDINNNNYFYLHPLPV
ncbi:hypothetical protein M0813_21780 [Anaeramoeba flamelloides]|uniref:Uncharacterized protein n=1 Tax=Anaeramoeba flamelloides TaxID=1746091 RepID=A0ABQ8YFJ2_9EUKA|nr:hypothetical protein M0813_21780 [Anaeramoeba flamelloides]